MTGSLDTSVLVRWIIRDAPVQLGKVEALFARPGRRYYVSLECFTELEHLLRSYYGLPRELIVGHFQVILSGEQFEVDEKIMQPIMKAYAAHPALSFVDCSLVTLAKLSGHAPIYTFDGKLAGQLPHAELVS